MSHRRTLTTGAAVVCAAFLALAGSTRTSHAERKVKIKEYEVAPVVITEVRNLQKEKDWLRDLEIEIKNVSDRPVYYVRLIGEFLDIPASPPERRADGVMPLKAPTAFILEYGDHRVVNAGEPATERGEPLDPGETYVFRLPKAYVDGFYNILKREGLPPEAADRIELSLHIIGFGDGSSVIEGHIQPRPRSRRQYAPHPTGDGEK